MVSFIQKRDGRIVRYDNEKVINSIIQAAKSVYKDNENKIDEYYSIARKYAREIRWLVNSKYDNMDEIPSVEDIQNIVESTLINHKEDILAKEYILYRNNRKRIRAAKNTLMNYRELVDNYLGIADWRVKENSTVTYSVGGLILSNSGAVTANYWLSEVYDEEIANAHRSAAIHIHDLSMLTGYCFTGDTRIKLIDGTVKTFKELVDSGMNEFWVYSKDSNGFTVPGKAVNPRITRRNANLVRVVLDNHEEIRCTPDHPFMMNDGSYKPAIELVTGDSLKPGYFLTTRNGYLGVSSRNYDSNSYKAFHRVVAEDVILGRQLRSDETVHHKDGNKYNNDPSNLEVMLDKDHRAMEIRKTMSTDKWKDANAIRLKDFNGSDFMREASRTRQQARNKSDRQKACCSYGASKNDLKNEEMKENYLSYVENNGFIGYNEYVDLVNPINHKVLFVEVLDYTEDVYDITVEKYHNFLLDAGVFVHNCAGWSLKQLIQEGLGGVPGKITSTPAGHLSTLCNQMVNFLGIMQNEWAGAQAFSSFDTYLAPFVKIDNLTQKEVKQCLQSFIFGVNTPSRWGTQAPFTNITLDWTVPNDLKNLNAIVGGKEQDFTYGDCQKEMDMVNKAFIEIMIEGDANGRGFQYPIPTYSITRDFDWSDTENNRLLFEMTAKYGTPYFSNYINSDMEPSDVRSMCCRLRLDLRELRKKSGGFFGSGESTGSIGVVTINMPRLAYESENEEDFYKRLDHLMDLSARSLHTKRTVITKLLDSGLYPYTKRYLGGFGNHFSTIGLVGMNEAGLNAKWIKKDLTTPETQKFAKDVLNHMRERLSDYQEKYEGELFNLEATPAESTSYRFAKHDREQYPDIITANMGGTPYYTNSSHLPVGYTEDIFSALDVQDELQTLYTSGTVFHAFLGEKLPSWKSAASLVRKIAENYRIPYYTISPTYSVCREHGYLSGEQAICPHCGQKTEVYSRITGYYRPVQNWNDGKAQEFKDRLVYNVEFDKDEESGLEVKSVSGTLEEPCYDSWSTNSDDSDSSNALLFVGETCPNCKFAESVLDKNSFIYKKMIANSESAGKFGIKQVPTLVILKKDESYDKYSGVSDIIGFLNRFLNKEE